MPDENTEIIEINAIDTDDALENDHIETAEISEPNILTCQGKLSNIDGEPLVGDYKLTFSLYETEVADEPSWVETQTVSVHEGLFSANLGQVNPISLPFGPDYWLGVTVEDELLMPRYKLASLGVVYRLDSGEYRESESTFLDNLSLTGSDIAQDVVLGGHSTQIVDGSELGNTAGGSSGTSGNNPKSSDDETSIPATAKTTKGKKTSTASSKSKNFRLQSISLTDPTSFKKNWSTTSHDAVIGAFNNNSTPGTTTYGVWATIVNSSGAGVMGKSTATTGDSYGVIGLSASTERPGFMARLRI